MKYLTFILIAIVTVLVGCVTQPEPKPQPKVETPAIITPAPLPPPLDAIDTNITSQVATMYIKNVVIDDITDKTATIRFDTTVTATGKVTILEAETNIGEFTSGSGTNHVIQITGLRQTKDYTAVIQAFSTNDDKTTARFTTISTYAPETAYNSGSGTYWYFMPYIPPAPIVTTAWNATQPVRVDN